MPLRRDLSHLFRLQASLALTEQQRAYLAQLRSVCLTALAGIIDERNAIHANLTVRAHYPAHLAGPNILL